MTGRYLARLEEDRTRAFLSDLETKGFTAPMQFSGYGGSNYAGAYGANASMPYIQNRPPGAKYDYQLEAGDLWRNTVAAICFGWMKRNFPEARPHVARRERGKGWVEAEGHELELILDNPTGAADLKNPTGGYDSDALWAATLVSWYCDGNAYWRKGTNLAGHTKQFWYTPHWQMFPRWDSDGRRYITHYEYVVDGKRQVLTPDQVVHFRNGIDIRNYRYGFPELGAAVREVCTDNEAAGYEATILRNLGIPGWIMSPESEDDTIEKEDRDAIKKAWREEFTSENRGGLLINSVRTRLERAALSPEEMALDKIRRIPQGRIVAAVGLNEQVLALHTEQPTYANYNEARKAAYHDCLVPTQRTMGRQLAHQCPELCKPGQILRFDQSEVEALQEDGTVKAKRAVILFQGGLAKKNEGRAMVSLTPEPGPTGEEYFEATMPTVMGATPAIGGNRIGSNDE